MKKKAITPQSVTAPAAFKLVPGIPSLYFNGLSCAGSSLPPIRFYPFAVSFFSLSRMCALPKRVAVLLCCLFFCAAMPSHAADFLLFPSFTGLTQSNAVPSTQSMLNPQMVFFYAASSDNFKFLSEYSADRDSQEMERLLLGWMPNSESTLWVGRYHIPLGYWATEFHHGTYLQTSITPPSIAFDDEGGPFPTHPGGLFYEGTHYQKRASINYGLGLGIGPVLDVQLQPLDILSPAGSSGRPVASARISYRPVAEDPSEIGVFAGHGTIPVMNQPVTGVVQNLAGMYFNQETERSRTFGELYLAGNRLYGSAASQSSSFASAYVQEEYKIYHAWTLFGRVENTFGAVGDAYLNLLPEFVNRRFLAGTRYEITADQAAKVELSQNRMQLGINFSQIALQWSMVLQ
jgi:hypothetical protein